MFEPQHGRVCLPAKSQIRLQNTSARRSKPADPFTSPLPVSEWPQEPYETEFFKKVGRVHHTNEYEIMMLNRNNRKQSEMVQDWSRIAREWSQTPPGHFWVTFGTNKLFTTMSTKHDVTRFLDTIFC